MKRPGFTPSAFAAVEQQLRASPPLVPAPPRLHGRVMAAVLAAPRAREARGGGVMLVRFALPAAACIAVAAAMATYLSRFSEPVAVPNTIAYTEFAAPGATVPVVDPTPIFLPAAQFLATSLDQHLANEAQSVLDDTRNAADFVVSCLPFTRGG